MNENAAAFFTPSPDDVPIGCFLKRDHRLSRSLVSQSGRGEQIEFFAKYGTDRQQFECRFRQQFNTSHKERGGMSRGLHVGHRRRFDAPSSATFASWFRFRSGRRDERTRLHQPP